MKAKSHSIGDIHCACSSVPSVTKKNATYIDGSVAQEFNEEMK